jgi:hypothetical protein
MSSLVIELEEASALQVTVGEVSLTVDLADGRTIIVPLVWYPRLWYGTPEERSHLEIIGGGTLIHWPDLDEDLSVAGLLTGRRSGESQKSLRRWLAERSADPKRPEGVAIEV